MKNIVMALGVSMLFVGCVVPSATIKPPAGIVNDQPIEAPIESPSSQQPTTSTPRREEVDPVYGKAPQYYTRAIRSYFSSKLKRASKTHYKFGEPKRAYKRRGLAYGGEVAWRGWLVETLIAEPTRTGRYLTPKPYMVLFSGEQIVEDILGNSHKLITKVDK